MTRTVEITLSDEEYRALRGVVAEFYPRKSIAQFVTWYVRLCLRGGLPLPEPEPAGERKGA